MLATINKIKEKTNINFITIFLVILLLFFVLMNLLLAFSFQKISRSNNNDTNMNGSNIEVSSRDLVSPANLRASVKSIKPQEQVIVFLQSNKEYKIYYNSETSFYFRQVLSDEEYALRMQEYNEKIELINSQTSNLNPSEPYSFNFPEPPYRETMYQCDSFNEMPLEVGDIAEVSFKSSKGNFVALSIISFN